MQNYNNMVLRIYKNREEKIEEEEKEKLHTLTKI